MGRPKKVVEENNAEIAGSIDFENDIEAIEEPKIFTKEEQERFIAEQAPLMSDIGWEAYALSKLTPKEIDNGNPKANGLRRLVKLLIGSVIESKASIRQCPDLENGQRATVEYTVTVNQTRNLEPDEEEHIISYTDVSDAWVENINGIEFARYPSAMASTRSEVRALRKILNISKAAAEEIATLPLDEAALAGYVTESQLTRLDIMCDKLDIDVIKFVNMGREIYENVRDVPYTKIQPMMKLLSDYQRQVKPIPDKIKDYDPSWRNEK